MLFRSNRSRLRSLYERRPSSKPAFFDRKFPGTYNARRDNLEGFWKDLFGFRQGIMIVNAFFENVSKHTLEGRVPSSDEEEQNVVIEFRPESRQEMLVACLWSRWQEGNEVLYSFAATSLRLKWRLQDTTAVLFPSRKITSMRGSIPIQRIWKRNMRFWTIGRGRIMSIDCPPDPAQFNSA